MLKISIWFLFEEYCFSLGSGKEKNYLAIFDSRIFKYAGTKFSLYWKSIFFDKKKVHFQIFAITFQELRSKRMKRISLKKYTFKYTYLRNYSEEK